MNNTFNNDLDTFYITTNTIEIDEKIIYKTKPIEDYFQTIIKKNIDNNLNIINDTFKTDTLYITNQLYIKNKNLERYIRDFIDINTNNIITNQTLERQEDSQYQLYIQLQENINYILNNVDNYKKEIQLLVQNELDNQPIRTHNDFIRIEQIKAGGMGRRRIDQNYMDNLEKVNIKKIYTDQPVINETLQLNPYNDKPLFTNNIINEENFIIDNKGSFYNKLNKFFITYTTNQIINLTIRGKQYGESTYENIILFSNLECQANIPKKIVFNPLIMYEKIQIESDVPNYTISTNNIYQEFNRENFITEYCKRLNVFTDNIHTKLSSFIEYQQWYDNNNEKSIQNITNGQNLLKDEIGNIKDTIQIITATLGMLKSLIITLMTAREAINSFNDGTKAVSDNIKNISKNDEWKRLNYTDGQNRININSNTYIDKSKLTSITELKYYKNIYNNIIDYLKNDFIKLYDDIVIKPFHGITFNNDTNDISIVNYSSGIHFISRVKDTGNYTSYLTFNNSNQLLYYNSEIVSKGFLSSNNYTKTESDNLYFNQTYINTNYYTKANIDYILLYYYSKIDADNTFYSKTQSDTLYYTKSYINGHYYTISSVDSLLNNYYQKGVSIDVDYVRAINFNGGDHPYGILNQNGIKFTGNGLYYVDFKYDGGTYKFFYNGAEIITVNYSYSKAESDNNYYYKSDVYTKSEINTYLSDKSSATHSHNDIYYTETEVDNLLTNYYQKGVNIDIDYVKSITFNSDYNYSILNQGGIKLCGNGAYYVNFCYSGGTYKFFYNSAEIITTNYTYSKSESDNNYYNKSNVYNKTESDNNYYNKSYITTNYNTKTDNYNSDRQIIPTIINEKERYLGEITVSSGTTLYYAVSNPLLLNVIEVNFLYKTTGTIRWKINDNNVYYTLDEDHTGQLLIFNLTNTSGATVIIRINIKFEQPYDKYFKPVLERGITYYTSNTMNYIYNLYEGCIMEKLIGSGTGTEWFNMSMDKQKLRFFSSTPLVNGKWYFTIQTLTDCNLGDVLIGFGKSDVSTYTTWEACHYGNSNKYHFSIQFNNVNQSRFMFNGIETYNATSSTLSDMTFKKGYYLSAIFDNLNNAIRICYNAPDGTLLNVGSWILNTALSSGNYYPLISTSLFTQFIILHPLFTKHLNLNGEAVNSWFESY